MYISTREFNAVYETFYADMECSEIDQTYNEADNIIISELMNTKKAQSVNFSQILLTN